MDDKRTVDEISIQELEKLIKNKKHEARLKSIQRMQQRGRVIEVDPLSSYSAIRSRIESSEPTQKQKRIAIVADNEQIEAQEGNEQNNSMWYKTTNFTLLFFEMALVFALIFVGFEMYSGINGLQQQTAETQRIAEARQRELVPTLEPTPQLTLTNVVLPTGHTPPNQVGGGQFNFDEIPAQMRSLIANQVFLPPDIERPLPTNETPLVLRIPKLDIDHTIVQGVDWEALKLGVGQVPNGATPTESNANVVLAAHNDIYGELFRYLDQLEPGDKFQIQTNSNLYNYTITGWDIYAPTAVEVMDKRGNATATLISCYPYQVNDKRIVVFADQDV